MGSTIARWLKVGFQTQTMTGVVLDLARVPSMGSLLAPQHQQLGVGGQDLTQSVLKLAASVNAPADVIHPLFGNPFDPFPSRSQEGQRPSGVSLARGAMPGGLSTTGIADGERTGKQILRQMELANQCQPALPESGGLRTFGLRLHRDVILQGYGRRQPNLRLRKIGSFRDALCQFGPALHSQTLIAFWHFRGSETAGRDPAEIAMSCCGPQKSRRIPKSISRVKGCTCNPLANPLITPAVPAELIFAAGVVKLG